MTKGPGVVLQHWEATSELAGLVREQTEKCLSVYREDRTRVLQDANNERRIAQGGYSTRQLEELVQNAVDATRNGGSRIEVALTPDTLYVANDGDAFDSKDVLSVMASDVSTKDDTAIGKFGIGFKSVLAVSDRPKVLSRSVCFGFDRAWSESTLIEAGYASEHYPVMRLARPLDPDAEARQDLVLADLMNWATTVIALPLRIDGRELSARLDDFPAEFVLFSPHVKRAALRNLAPRDVESRVPRQGERVITQADEGGGLVRLHNGSESSLWSVARVVHEPSTSALKDAGHVADRDELLLQYALQVPPGSALGRFWSYFPTAFETTMAGLINAPWKLSDDRVSLLESPFNTEILALLPGLFGTAIQRLDGSDNVLAALDAMPARGKEDRNWADAWINEPVFAHLRGVPCLPDGSGHLRVPGELKWLGDAEEEWLKWWSEVPGAPVERWVHPDAYRTAERRNKVERLRREGEKDPSVAGLDAWLQDLALDGTTEASAAAILLAARIIGDEQESMDPTRRQRIHATIRRARIVRLEDGTLAAPNKGKVFVRVPGEDREDVQFVDPDLADLPGVRDALSELGVVLMDRTGELRALLARARVHDPNQDPGLVWSKIWEILRELPTDAAHDILREDLGDELESATKVKTAAGSWTTPGECFLAGFIVSADSARDRDFLIDPAFHREDVELLRAIGAVDVPTRRHHPPEEDWHYDYEEEAAQRFIKSQKGAKPDRFKLLFEGADPPWPLEPLTKMSDEARAAATELLISQGLDGDWIVRHSSNASYGRLGFPSPEVWFLRKHGRIRTSFGLLRPRQVLFASEGIDPDVLPAMETSEDVAEALALKSGAEEYTTYDWGVLKKTADGWASGNDDDRRRADFYAWLPGRIQPETLVARVGPGRKEVELDSIGVTADRPVYESMVEAAIPALFVSDPADVDRFVDLWEMQLGTDLLQEEIVVERGGEDAFLTDLYPPLKLWLQPEDQDLVFRPAVRIEKMVATRDGQLSRQITLYREGDTVVATSESHEERLAAISDLLGLGMGHDDIASVLDAMARSSADELRAQVRAAEDLDERLIAAVGGIDPLRRIIPAQAILALESRPEGVTPAEIAGLARAVHGVLTLKQLRPVLEERGLEPPREWAGRRLTRNWVRELGFPIEWAGFADASRPATEQIDGPSTLKPLHVYQVQVTERITALLRGIGKDRGMVSLPTGAGKTRVTVQALVDGVRDGDIPVDVPLLWIAQTDELCEQAAETWTHVWRAIGAGRAMSLGRLWGNNEVSEDPTGFQLIIATIDKLDKIRKRATGDYDWLREPSVVVVDEAHTSIATTYTTVLDWLGRASRGRDSSSRRPLIGLTATPFRGTSNEETKRLVGRYDGNRLDWGSFHNNDDPYGELQEMGVLARVSQRLLDGTDVHLTDADLAEIERTRRLPSTVTNRLGADLQRTQRVVEDIASLPEDWTILVFTPSVENSRVLAALLSHRGVPAASVSAETETPARRHYIEEFRAGRLRVLTNYGVLTQGFDAPRVQAVYLTRPTFSPNVYQQMVGRGLRGIANGGSEEVLVVNMRDNFEKYGELLAFNEFEYLWRQS